METPARVAAWISFAILAALTYAPVTARLVAAWWSDADYSHGLVCAPLAAAIIVSRRRALRSDLRPHGAGFAGAVVSLGLLALGTLGAEVFLTRVSLLLFAASTVVFLCGWRHVRTLAFPLALIALSMPIPALVMTRVTLPLQFAASIAAEHALGVFHIPVLREGNVLVLSNATLQVAEACSGVRSMMSLVVVGLVIARYVEHRAAARVAIVAAAIPVTIAVNALRVTATALATDFYGLAAAEGVIHESIGIALFVLSTALLAGCARAVAAVGARTSTEAA